MTAIPHRKPALAGKSAYEANTVNTRTANWDRRSYGPNAAFDDGDIARARSQNATRNNPWLRRALSILVSHEIGCGLQPRPALSDAGLRKELQGYWKHWVYEADADGTSDFYGLQGLISRARRESGEAFVRMRDRYPEDGLIVPFQVQALEANMVPIRHNGSNGKNTIRQGIERTPFGSRAAFWVHRQHPGEAMFLNVSGNYQPSELTRVPAPDMLHHYTPERPGQLRGVPTPISSLLRARNFDDYESAELTRKKSRSKFVGAIYRETDDENPVTDDPVKIEEDLVNRERSRAFVDLEDGYLLSLSPDERMQLYDGDSGNVGIDFLRVQLRAIAAGMGVPYEIMSGDYGDTNDRIMKVILNAFYRELEMTQDLLVSQVLAPIWNRWLDRVAMLKIVKIPNYFEYRRDYQRCEWRAHAWSYPNPLQEVQTLKIMKDEGFSSRAGIVSGLGWDVEDVDQQNADDADRERKMNLRYGTKQKGSGR